MLTKNDLQKCTHVHAWNNARKVGGRHSVMYDTTDRLVCELTRSNVSQEQVPTWLETYFTATGRPKAKIRKVCFILDTFAN